MRTSRFNALKSLVETPKKHNIKKGSRLHYLFMDLLRDGYARTGYYTGTGRHTRGVDLSFDVKWILDGMGISYESGNDAPRGGVTGNYVQITMPAFMNQIKKIKKAKEQEKARIKAEEAARQAVLEAEAAKIDLELYREEIIEIINRDSGREDLTSKEVGKCIWVLINKHKGLNPAALKIALWGFKIKK